MDEHRMFDAIADLDESIIDKCLAEAKSAKHKTKSTRSVSNRRRVPWYALAAAALLIFMLGGAAFGFGSKLMSRAVSLTVTLDVNPSIEIRLNRHERVAAVVPLNEDAKKVIGEMDFEGASLDLTVNALIGAMVRNGYLGELANSVLVTVDDNDEKRADELTRYLASVIDEALEPQGGGAVIGFTASHDTELEKLAEQHGITLGKAMLIQKVVDAMPYYGFDELVVLNINELNMLLDPNTSGMTHVGTPKTNMISSAEAAATALEAAGFTDAVLTRKSGKYVTPPTDAFLVEIRGSSDMFYLISDLCLDNGGFVYWIEFRNGDIKYDIRVDAYGKEAELFRCPIWSSYYGLTPSHRSRLISENIAVNIVLERAGVSPLDIDALDVHIGSDGTTAVYSIEFRYSNSMWKATVNARTGEVMDAANN